MRGKEIVQPLIARLLADAGYKTDEVRVDDVKVESVPGLRDAPGKLGMTFLPGKRGSGQAGDHWRDLDSDARTLRDMHRVDTLLLLVEDHELEAARVRDIEGVMQAHGIELLRHPIVDMGIPTDPLAFREMLGGLTAQVNDGKNVAIACLGGLGRTGTTVACLLVDAGLDPDAAIELTRASRHGTIERPSQEEFVRRWRVRR